MAGYLRRKVEVVGNRIVETIVINAAQDAAQKVVLTEANPTQLLFNIPCGTSQIEDFDYELINGNEVSWAGKSLETSLSEGDTIIISYNN